MTHRIRWWTTGPDGLPAVEMRVEIVTYSEEAADVVADAVLDYGDIPVFELTREEER